MQAQRQAVADCLYQVLLHLSTAAAAWPARWLLAGCTRASRAAGRVAHSAAALADRCDLRAQMPTRCWGKRYSIVTTHHAAISAHKVAVRCAPLLLIHPAQPPSLRPSLLPLELRRPPPPSFMTRAPHMLPYPPSFLASLGLCLHTHQTPPNPPLCLQHRHARLATVLFASNRRSRFTLAPVRGRLPRDPSSSA